MSRISYKNSNWVDLKGLRQDIMFRPVVTEDYYFHVPESCLVLQLFSKGCEGHEPLGEVINKFGQKVGSIPPLIHYKYRGESANYRSRVAWVQGCTENVVSFVIYCQALQDFRVKLNLDTMEYSEPDFNIR